VIEDSPHTGVTCSPYSIDSSNTEKLYITPRSEKPKKEHADAYYETAVRMFSGIDPRLTPFDTLVIDQMVAWVKKPDAFMICGAEKCGNWFGVSKATAQASLNRIEKCGYFRCFKKGNGRGNASKYVLGELYSKGRREWIQEQLLANEYSSRPQNFVRTKPKAKPRGRPFLKGERVQKSATFNNTERVQKSAHKGCKNLLSHPIGQPIHTHTEELPSAFNKECWLKECLKLNPSRDLKDIDYTFHLAKSEGANDDNWMLSVRRYDRSYNPRSKIPTAPARPSPAPRPAVKSSCESPKQAPLDYDNPKVLDDELYDALRNGVNPSFIIASVKDPALAQSVLAKVEARLETSRDCLRMH
jgi:hypothetical protein